jgi:putative transport protein
MAILAINTGPGAYKAIQGGIVGPVLISAVIVGFIPMTVAWFIGIHALKLNSALLLGAVCGARQDAAGLKVVQERFESSVPAVAFALPYTVSTLVFTVYGYLLEMKHSLPGLPWQ